MKLGDNGTIVPLRRMIDRSRLFTVVREYVATHLCFTLDPIDIQSRFLEDLHSRLLNILRPVQ